MTDWEINGSTEADEPLLGKYKINAHHIASLAGDADGETAEIIAEIALQAFLRRRILGLENSVDLRSFPSETIKDLAEITAAAAMARAAVAQVWIMDHENKL